MFYIGFKSRLLAHNKRNNGLPAGNDCVGDSFS